jgi:sugar lactone lactonase YvrE
MKIREIARGLQFPEGPVAMDDGSVLLVEIARGTLSRVRPDGQVQVVADLGGGPNGAAIGPDGAVYVCNNGGFRWTTESDGCHRPIGQAEDYSGGRIERVDLATGRFERLFDSVEGLALRGPNDIVFDAAGGFYFTDLGKVRANDMDRGGVFYASTDGRAPKGHRAAGDDAERHRPLAGRQHALLRRDRGRAPLGLRHHRRRAKCGARAGRRRTAGGWSAQRPAATTSASIHSRSTRSATSASRR